MQHAVVERTHQLNSISFISYDWEGRYLRMPHVVINTRSSPSAQHKTLLENEEKRPARRAAIANHMKSFSISVLWCVW